MADIKTDISIDLKGWITQVEYAKQHGYKLSTVSRWVKRAKDGEGRTKIQFLEVPQLGITLVKSIN